MRFCSGASFGESFRVCKEQMNGSERGKAHAESRENNIHNQRAPHGPRSGERQEEKRGRGERERERERAASVYVHFQSFHACPQNWLLAAGQR